MPRKKGDLRGTLAVLGEAAKLLREHAKELSAANDAVEAEVRRAQALLGGRTYVIKAGTPAPLEVASAPPLMISHEPPTEEALRAQEEEAELMKAAMQKAGVAPREETLAEKQAREQREFLNSVHPERAKRPVPQKKPSSLPDLPGPVIEPSAREDLT
jgi:hypothetical protein